MKYSGLYLVNNPSTNLDASLNIVNTLIQGTETSFQNVTRQAPWSLSYRAFRDTIPPGYQPSTDAEGKPKPFAHAFQHLLHLSSLSPSRTYVYIQPPTEPGTVVAIPLAQQDAYASTIRHQSAALWTPRHILSIQQGASYSGGLCTIQIGELRATREGPQSSATQSPGVVVCISTVVGADSTDYDPGSASIKLENGTAADGDEEPDFDYAQTVIRDCWQKIQVGRDLGRSEVREVMMASTVTTTQEQERQMAVRMWCDVLRLRGISIGEPSPEPRPVGSEVSLTGDQIWDEILLP